MDTQPNLSYASFASSEPFKFEVGAEKKTFFVHSELIAQRSPTLSSVVKGPWKTTEQRTSSLEEWDEETFTRFVEFAYSGNYTSPQSEVVPLPKIESDEADGGAQSQLKEANGDIPINREADLAPSEIVPEKDLVRDEPDANDELGLRGFSGSIYGSKSKASRKDKHKKQNNGWFERKEAGFDFHSVTLPSPPFPAHQSKRARLWEEFSAKASPEISEPWLPERNTELEQSYANVFLCHASLYVFSDQFSIDAMRELSLRKLRLTLSRFMLFNERIEDVLGLIRYSYAHTMAHDTGTDKLRSLVAEYASCHVEDLIKDEDFREFSDGEGLIGRDLIVKLTERLD